MNKPLKFLTAATLVFSFFAGSITATAQDEPVVNKLTDHVYAIFAVFYNSLVVIGEDEVLITDPANLMCSSHLCGLQASTICISRANHD